MKYGVLEVTRTHVAGDKRSIINPGHGYPAHVVTGSKFTEFDDEDALNVFLKQKDAMNKGLKDLRIIRFEEVELKRKLSFEMT